MGISIRNMPFLLIYNLILVTYQNYNSSLYNSEINEYVKTFLTDFLLIEKDNLKILDLSSEDYEFIYDSSFKYKNNLGNYKLCNKTSFSFYVLYYLDYDDFYSASSKNQILAISDNKSYPLFSYYEDLIFFNYQIISLCLPNNLNIPNNRTILKDDPFYKFFEFEFSYNYYLNAYNITEYLQKDNHIVKELSTIMVFIMILLGLFSIILTILPSYEVFYKKLILFKGFIKKYLYCVKKKNVNQKERKEREENEKDNEKIDNGLNFSFTSRESVSSSEKYENWENSIFKSLYLNLSDWFSITLNFKRLTYSDSQLDEEQISKYVNDTDFFFVNGIKSIFTILLIVSLSFWFYLQSPYIHMNKDKMIELIKENSIILPIIYWSKISIYPLTCLNAFVFSNKFLCYYNKYYLIFKSKQRKIKQKRINLIIINILIYSKYIFDKLFLYILFIFYFFISLSLPNIVLSNSNPPFSFIINEIISHSKEFWISLFNGQAIFNIILSDNTSYIQKISIFYFQILFLNEIFLSIIFSLILILYQIKKIIGLVVIVLFYFTSVVIGIFILNNSKIYLKFLVSSDNTSCNIFYYLGPYIIGILAGILRYEYIMCQIDIGFDDEIDESLKLIVEENNDKSELDDISNSNTYTNNTNTYINNPQNYKTDYKIRNFIKNNLLNRTKKDVILHILFSIYFQFFVICLFIDVFVFLIRSSQLFNRVGLQQGLMIYWYFEKDIICIFLIIILFKYMIFNRTSLNSLFERKEWNIISRLYYSILFLMPSCLLLTYLSNTDLLIFVWNSIIYLMFSIIVTLIVISTVFFIVLIIPLKLMFKSISKRIFRLK